MDDVNTDGVQPTAGDDAVAAPAPAGDVAEETTEEEAPATDAPAAE